MPRNDRSGPCALLPSEYGYRPVELTHAGIVSAAQPLWLRNRGRADVRVVATDSGAEEVLKEVTSVYSPNSSPAFLVTVARSSDVSAMERQRRSMVLVFVFLFFFGDGLSALMDRYRHAKKGRP